jgi:energy-converting hydrogenase Eha subunit H
VIYLKEWLFDQVYHFNVIIFISIMVFNVALSKSNTQKMLQNQSKELYLEIEEVKDEIRELTIIFF